jgi:hypothetical protein
MEDNATGSEEGCPYVLMLLYNNVAELRQIRGGHSDCYLSTDAKIDLR